MSPSRSIVCNCKYDIMHHFIWSTFIQFIHYFVNYSHKKTWTFHLLQSEIHSPSSTSKMQSLQLRISIQMESWFWSHAGCWVSPTFTTVNGRNISRKSTDRLPQTKQQVNPPSSPQNLDSSIMVAQEFYRLLKTTSLMLCLNCASKAFKLTHELFARRHHAWVTTFGTRCCSWKKHLSIAF